MSRIEISELVENKLHRQTAPSVVGTLKRCECEIGNLLDCNVLEPEWREIFLDLGNQIQKALESDELEP